MDKHDNITHQLDLVSGHVRLLADLMLAGPNLQDVDRSAFALVLQDLASRLQRATQVLDGAESPPLNREEEGRP